MLKLERPGIMVKGTRGALQIVLPQLQQLVSDIVVAEHHVDAPGMPQYFTEEKGTLMV